MNTLQKGICKVRTAYYGSMPAKGGGWNRFQIEANDLAGMVETLRKAGAHFRNDIVMGTPASRRRHRRQPDSARRPFRQSDRAVRSAAEIPTFR